MKLIIVPTDFSPLADNALKYAMDLASAMDGSIMLLNVYQLFRGTNGYDFSRRIEKNQ